MLRHFCASEVDLSPDPAKKKKAKYLLDESSVSFTHHIHFDLPALSETGGLLLVARKGHPLRHRFDEPVALVTRDIVEVVVGHNFLADILGLQLLYRLDNRGKVVDERENGGCGAFAGTNYIGMETILCA